MIQIDNIARDVPHGDNINRNDGIQRNYFNRARRIDVEERSNAPLTDYQFLISGLVDGRDRIHNREGGALPLWIESATRAWTRGNVPAMGRTNFVQYMGNPTASSASSGVATFDFFDGFYGTAIDTSRWTIVDATGWSVVDGELRGTSTTGRLLSIPTFSSPIIQEVRIRTVTLPPSGYTTAGFRVSSTNQFILHIHPPTWNDVVWNDGVSHQIGAVANTINIPYLIRFTAMATNVNLAIIRLDTGETTYNVTWTNTILTEQIMLGRRPDDIALGEAYNAFWDWIRVRKHTSPEPTVVVGQEVPLT